MAIKEREGYWHLDIKIPGKPRIRRTTGIKVDGPKSRAKAQEIHDREKAELYDRVNSGTTLYEALVLWLRVNTRSEKEKSAIRVFKRIFPDKALCDLRGTDIHDALLYKSPATANRTLNIIRAALNLAHERGLCEEIKIPRRQVPKSKTRFLTPEEWQRLVGKLPGHVLSMAYFALATGLRLSNVNGLQWKNVSLKTRKAWVNPDEAKGGALIMIPLSEQAIEILNAQFGKHPDFVFTYKGRPIKSTKKAWKRALVNAGIDVVQRVSQNGPDKGKPYLTSTFRWHDLRHTWASWHIQAGTPLAALKELGAWKSLDMVMRYAHLTPEHLSQHVDAISANFPKEEM